MLKQVIVTVEDDAQARKILRVLERGETSGRLGFAFGTEIKDSSEPGEFDPTRANADRLTTAACAVIAGLDWERTREGHEFWRVVYSRLQWYATEARRVRDAA